MFDPWTDKREKAKDMDKEELYSSLRDVLIDSYALLSVVRADLEYDAAFLEWYDATVNTNDEERIAKAKSRQAKAIAARREAIAALPEHLKLTVEQEEDKDERKDFSLPSGLFGGL